MYLSGPLPGPIDNFSASTICAHCLSKCSLVVKSIHQKDKINSSSTCITLICYSLHEQNAKAPCFFQQHEELFQEICTNCLQRKQNEWFVRKNLPTTSQVTHKTTPFTVALFQKGFILKSCTVPSHNAVCAICQANSPCW